MTEVDVSDPAALKVMKTLTLDGAYVDARQVGSTVRVVSSSPVPVELPFVSPSTTATAARGEGEERTRSRIVARLVWLPTYRLGKQKAHALVQCRDVRRPIGFSGLGMLTVLTIDLAKGLDPVDSTAVMTDGRIVYASPTTLYVATEQWSTGRCRRRRRERAERRQDADQRVRHLQPGEDDLPRERHGAGLPAQPVVAVGVPGRAARRLDRLARVVGRRRYRQPVVPDDAAGRAAAAHADRPGRRARPGRERLRRAVIGNTGYVVTFNQVDPLFTLDLPTRRTRRCSAS